MSGFTLRPLDCPSCGAGLAAEGEDVAFYCTACRNGYLFERQSGELRPLEVSFVALAGKQASRYLPFWVLPAKVAIRDRSGRGPAASQLLPGEGRAFAVPAFATTLARATALVARYSRELPRLGERLGERLTGGSLRVEDARTLARFALVEAEVKAPDTLTALEFEVEFGEPRLLGVPFVGLANQQADAFFGLPA
jgi:hypothetical protein